MKFAPPIRIHGAGGMLLIQGQALRLPIHDGAAAKDQRLQLLRLHGLQQTDGSLQVVGLIVHRVYNRLAYRLESSKMHHGIATRKGLCNLSGV